MTRASTPTTRPRRHSQLHGHTCTCTPAPARLHLHACTHTRTHAHSRMRTHACARTHAHARTTQRTFATPLPCVYSVQYSPVAGGAGAQPTGRHGHQPGHRPRRWRPHRSARQDHGHALQAGHHGHALLRRRRILERHRRLLRLRQAVAGGGQVPPFRRGQRLPSQQQEQQHQGGALAAGVPLPLPVPTERFTRPMHCTWTLYAHLTRMHSTCTLHAHLTHPWTQPRFTLPRWFFRSKFHAHFMFIPSCYSTRTVLTLAQVPTPAEVEIHARVKRIAESGTTT